MDDTMVTGAANTVDTAYERLRDRLVTFKVKPGSRLNESELALDLGMSRAPIREALNRLTADGLVGVQPGRGFFCRRLSVSEIADLYAVRRDLETGALRDLLTAASDKDIAELVEKWRTSLAQAEGADLEALVDADEAFHIDLASMAGNGPRVKYLLNINDRIRFVRRINLETPGRSADALAEHARLLDAICARDLDRSHTLLCDHLDRSRDEVRQMVAHALARIYADEVA